jgi:transposase
LVFVYLILLDMLLTDIKSETDLPTDPLILRSLLWSIIGEFRSLSESYALLRKELYGRKSEKHIIDSEQTQLTDILSQVAPTAPAEEKPEDGFVEIKPHQRRKHPGRNALPVDVKHERHVIDVPDEEKSCQGCDRFGTCKYTELPVFEEVVRKVVERKAPEYILHEYVRLKRGCPIEKDTVVVAEPPLVTPIAKGLAGLNLLLFVILGKYQFHLPLYRIQRQIFHESRIWFTRSTMVGWIAELCVLIKPLYLAMIDEVKKSPVIHSDDTPVKQATRESGAHASFMWVYVGLQLRCIVFDYKQTRGGEAPRSFLHGVIPGTHLMSDGYAGYNAAVQKYGLIPMACMMHIRREFVEAAQVGSSKPFALDILKRIGKLYLLERQAKKQEYTDEQRLQMRQTQSAPIMADIKQLLQNPVTIITPGSRIGKAINYALNQWAKAEVFLSRGDLPIDNGPSERAVRDLAIGRNNWMTVGSDEGGKRMAMLYSIIATCKINGIDIPQYLSDILMRLAMRPEGASVADLTPIEWLKTKNNGILPPLTPIYPSKS